MAILTCISGEVCFLISSVVDLGVDVGGYFGLFMFGRGTLVLKFSKGLIRLACLK